MDPFSFIKMKSRKGNEEKPRPPRRRKRNWGWLEHGFFLLLAFFIITSIGNGVLSLQRDILTKFDTISEEIYDTAWSIGSVHNQCTFIQGRILTPIDEQAFQNLYSQIDKNNEDLNHAYHSLGHLISYKTYVFAIHNMACLSVAVVSTSPNTICSSDILPANVQLRKIRDAAIAALTKERKQYEGIINGFAIYIKTFFDDQREKPYTEPSCDPQETSNWLKSVQ